MITENAKSLALQTVLFFMLCKIEGLTRLEAIELFAKRSPICKEFGDKLTVGNVWGLMEVAGY